MSSLAPAVVREPVAQDEPRPLAPVRPSAHLPLQVCGFGVSRFGRQRCYTLPESGLRSPGDEDASKEPVLVPIADFPPPATVPRGARPSGLLPLAQWTRPLADCRHPPQISLRQ